MEKRQFCFSLEPIKSNLRVFVSCVKYVAKAKDSTKEFVYRIFLDNNSGCLTFMSSQLLGNFNI